MPILQWLDRDKHTKIADQVPYRLLEADDKLSYGDADSPNMLIQGDNLEALKALLPYYAGRVKCIYIDPPFNTGAAFDHYDDNLEHSIWLGLMLQRFRYLHELLAGDGTLFLHLDNSQAAYAKVLLDEVFGRNNFLNWITMTTNDPSGFKATGATIFSTANHLLIYAKEKATKPLKKTHIAKSYDAAYNKVLLNRSDDYRQWKWVSISAHVCKSLGFDSEKAARKELKEEFDYEIESFALRNPEVVFQIAAIGGGAAIKRRSTIEKSSKDRNKVYVHPNEDVPDFYIVNGRQILFYDKRFVEIDNFKVPAEVITDVWTDISWNGIAPEGGVKFKNGKKPEELIKRVLEIATNPNDLILDSFLGSGTTAAVAHKMGRHYIGIEMGEQSYTHCAPRLVKVIDGEQSGISETVGWKGGGGFRFYKLGATVFDTEGRINPEIRFAHLAAHIWFAETHTALHKKAKTPLLGVHNGTAYYLLYNGILGDKRPDGGNVLTSKVLAELPKHDGPKTIYGEACRLGEARLKALNIIFKQTPYDIKAR